MNDRITLLALKASNPKTGWLDRQKFAQLIVAEAFRAGILYSAKKYAAVGDDRFTGNDVAMFLEMEACELSDEDIKQHFGVKE